MTSERRGLWWIAGRTWDVTDRAVHLDGATGPRNASVARTGHPRTSLLAAGHPRDVDGDAWPGYMPSDLEPGALVIGDGHVYRIAHRQLDPERDRARVTAVRGPDFPYVRWLHQQYDSARSANPAVWHALLDEITTGASEPALMFDLPLSPAAVTQSPGFAIPTEWTS